MLNLVPLAGEQVSDLEIKPLNLKKSKKTHLKKVGTKEIDLMTKKRKIFEQLEDIEIEISRNEDVEEFGSCDKDDGRRK